MLNDCVVSNDGGVACCEDDGVDIEEENEGPPVLLDGLFLGLVEVVFVVDGETVDDRDGSAARR